jgi:hypothetical protein
MSLTNSNDSIGNGTRDLPVCSIVPWPLRHRAPPLSSYLWKIIVLAVMQFLIHIVLRTWIFLPSFKCLSTIDKRFATVFCKISYKSNGSLSEYLLIPCSRVILEKLTSVQLVKKFPAFYGIRWFITALTSARQLSLSWARSIQFNPPQPTSWRSILILSSDIRLSLPYLNTYTHLWQYLWFLKWEMLQTKEKIRTHILCSIHT